MKITIFSGGSGSEEIQKGLWNIFGENIETHIIINGYDDGLSTGIVRSIYNNTILGPSDLRKNQLIRHKLRYGETPIYLFLNHRFTSDNPKEYVLNKLSCLNENLGILKKYIELFFSTKNSKLYKYQNFNIGNIIYSSLFYNEGIKDAIIILNSILKIPNEVLFQCNKSFLLKAITEQNVILNTEEEIVNFNNHNDKIKDVYFLDNENIDIGVGVPYLEKEVINIMNTSDIIIFSSGTQWSSLIPTYKSEDFLKNIDKAKKYLVFNISNDYDMINCDLNDYFNLYKKYLPVNDICFLLENKNYDMEILKKYNYLLLDNIAIGNKHKGNDLIIQIFMDYYRDVIRFNHYVFDYDTINVNNKLSEKIVDEINKLEMNVSLILNSLNSLNSLNLQNRELKINCETIYNDINGYKYLENKYNNDNILFISNNNIEVKSKYIISQSNLYLLLKVLNNKKLYLNDLIIIAGGLNMRMKIDYPKLLMDVNGKTTLEIIYEKSKNFIRKLYIFTNKKYYNLFDHTKYNVICCNGYNSDIPNGNLQTLYYGMKQINATNNITVMWGDCIPNTNIFLELNVINKPFYIPCINESNPYAYIIPNGEVVEKILFYKDIPIEKGLHDNCIFSINWIILNYVIDKYKLYENPNENHLFDTIEFLNKEQQFVTYYMTKHKSYSFNTTDKLSLIKTLI